MNILQLGCFRYLDTHITDYLLYKENKVYVVDANPKAIHSIKETYKCNNLHTLNVAISSKKEDEISFYIPNRRIEEHYTASCNLDHILKHGHHDYTEIKVKAFTLHDVLDYFNISDLDILYIDIEGNDLIVLDSIENCKQKIDSIVYESTHISLPSNHFLYTKYRYKKLDQYNSCFYKETIPKFSA
jgi:FkbM family methyltransferase